MRKRNPYEDGLWNGRFDRDRETHAFGARFHSSATDDLAAQAYFEASAFRTEQEIIEMVQGYIEGYLEEVEVIPLHARGGLWLVR